MDMFGSSRSCVWLNSHRWYSAAVRGSALDDEEPADCAGDKMLRSAELTHCKGVPFRYYILVPTLCVPINYTCPGQGHGMYTTTTSSTYNSLLHVPHTGKVAPATVDGE